MTTKQIRYKIWLRQAGRCLDCDKFVTLQQAHLHELVFRSKGGKISLDNSVILCSNCHLNGPQNHGDRKPQFRGGSRGNKVHIETRRRRRPKESIEE